MENEMRELIDQVKSIGKSVNEELVVKPRTAKEIIKVLRDYGIEVSKDNFYNGSNYGQDYSVIGSDEVDGKSHYGYHPMKVKAQGFITKDGGKLENFYFHNGKWFDTTSDIDEFLRWIGKI